LNEEKREIVKVLKEGEVTNEVWVSLSEVLSTLFVEVLLEEE